MKTAIYVQVYPGGELCWFMPANVGEDNRQRSAEEGVKFYRIEVDIPFTEDAVLPGTIEEIKP